MNNRIFFWIMVIPFTIIAALISVVCIAYSTIEDMIIDFRNKRKGVK